MTMMTSRSRALWLVPACMAVHNAEEALYFPRFLWLVLERLPETWRAVPASFTTWQVRTALGVVTLIPFGLAVWATLRPRSAIAIWLLLLVQATLLVNVLWHVGVAIFLLDGYAPGVVTAVLLNLPVSVYLLRRAVRENWVSPQAGRALLPGALLLHGPLLLGLALVAERA
jgi:hypothetical protein